MGQPRIMSNSNPDVNALGVVALELAGGEQPGKAALGSEQAGELAALIGRDLTVQSVSAPASGGLSGATSNRYQLSVLLPADVADKLVRVLPTGEPIVVLVSGS